MQHLNIEEIKSLVNEIRQPRWKLMVLVGFWHGLRASELTGMVGADIRDGFVNVQRLKGSLRTIQPYVKHDDPLLDEFAGLTKLANQVGPKERLFDITRRGLYAVIERAGSRAGIPRHKLHPHILKHSIALQTIQSAGIENVRQWLGHKTISSTGSYLRVTDAAASHAISNAMGTKVST